ncbi:hypothetical protein K432DRAFT_420720 [Lepidopterella palustris CBS 459.81]|uniref:NACHT domain-containing protein n=1 Tax=Lepidopterella palustris CBS 459.81 TaxID=1314670 RepID=A0A8E2J8P5_9PEZI|nr:hypothetical protein K432DRAFT_420720 [Lepidopterella palustris CBS 459.81]
MGGIAIGIQAHPEISSLVVGAVRIVIDLAIDFVTFFSKLADMLCQFEDYLGPLAEYAKASQDFALVQETVANVYGDLLDFCQKARRVFVDANGNLRKLTSLRLFLRQQWEPFETGFAPIKADMQHHMDVLLHSAQALQLNINREAKQERRQLKLQENKKERESFLDWISTIDFEKIHDDIYIKKHEGTGDWLIRTQEFRTWFSSPKSSLLWCHGKPGVGKSVLASNVLEHLTSDCALDENIAICFAYYNYRTPELWDISSILAAMIKQLCRKRDIIPNWLLDFKHDSLSPSTASKQESFIKLAEDLGFNEVYVVIDALDECPERERHYIIGFITETINTLPCAKFFVTSRRETDIVRAFEERSTPTIQIKAENVAADIEGFVHSEVKKLRHGYHGKKLHLTSDVLEARIIQTLTEKAEGMFLWVNLQLESLCRISEAQKDRLVEAALDTLPQGLDETYTRIVEQIDDQSEYMKRLALNCLMWIFYAKRPLRTQELQHALALATDETCQKQTDIDVDKVEVILKACGNLLEEEHDTIRPVHYSVQEFFMNPPGKMHRRRIQESIADSDSVHIILTSVCLRYIQLGTLSQPCKDPFEILYLVTGAPFAWYAAQCFDYHALQCKILPRDILELLEGLLYQDGALLAAIIQMRNLQDGFDYDWIIRDFDPVSFLVSASTIIYGTHLFEIDHIRTGWIDLTPPKYALHQASSTGLVNAVKRLLEQGCDINERDKNGASPIYYASVRSHLATAQLLLSEGAHINAQGGRYGNALQAASVGGHNKIVELLLSKGADVNAQGGEPHQDFQAAAKQGCQRQQAKRVLRKRTPGSIGRRPRRDFQAAAKQGRQRQRARRILRQRAPGGIV